MNRGVVSFMAATAALIAAFVICLPLHAQVPLDPCKVVNPDDVAALVTLNQATVETRPMEPGSDKCTFTMNSPFGEAGEVDIRTSDMGSHEQATARLKQDLPFYFDKKPPLVKTNDPSDHVLSMVQPNGSEARAVHGKYLVELEVSQLQDAAKAHPTWEYRLQRTALQAAGATILPTEGLPPDPVLPKREAPSASAQEAAHNTGFTSLFSFFGALSLVGLVGPLIAIFVIFRVFVAPRSLRKRLLAGGIPGIARIDRITDTGVTINGNPQVHYFCTVTPAGGTPYLASTKAVVSRLVAPAGQVGGTAAVRIDPKDPQRFIFA